MKYTCRKCGKRFEHTDPLDPERVIPWSARICRECREKKHNMDYVVSHKKSRNKYEAEEW